MSKKNVDQEWLELKDAYANTKTCMITEKGVIDFNPDIMKDVVGAEKLSYDEYLDILYASAGKCRKWFEVCFHECSLSFAGEIEKKTKTTVCFKRIFVSGMYRDGICFDGKEDHVWMDIAGFEKYSVGDSIEFFAEVYRYLKTGNGKLIDFGLRNPEGIKKIEGYALPSDDDLVKQEIDSLICEVCPLTEHCFMGNCIADKNWRKEMQKTLYDATKSNSKERG